MCLEIGGVLVEDSGVDELLKIGFFSDTHISVSRKDAVPTLSELLAYGDYDYIVNGGDNEGKYARRIADMIRSIDIPFVSILGNHDVSAIKKNVGDDYRLIKSYYKKGVPNFYSQDLGGLQPTLTKWGYGRFGPKSSIKFVHPINESLMYYLVVESDIGDVALTLRHYPLYLHKDYDIKLIGRIKKEFPDVEVIYAIGGHTHSKYISMDTQELHFANEDLPVVSVVLSPFTLNKGIILGGIYNISVLADGSLSISESYLRDGEIKKELFALEKSSDGLLRATAVKGELVGYA